MSPDDSVLAVMFDVNKKPSRVLVSSKTKKISRLDFIHNHHFCWVDDEFYEKHDCKWITYDKKMKIKIGKPFKGTNGFFFIPNSLEIKLNKILG